MSKSTARALFWSVIVLLAVLRFWRLDADFPNHSPWLADQAKFTDEGWYGDAAIRHSLTGHWRMEGDFNPAVALPAWPLLLSAVFGWTGVSLVAARALAVGLSLATFLVVYALLRRYTGEQYEVAASTAVLLLACSPFVFAFSRLAILETLVVLQFCLALLLASYVGEKRFWPSVVLAALIPCMVLTKSTSAALAPAIFWLAWKTDSRKTGVLQTGRGGFRRFLQATLCVVIIPAAVLSLYWLAVKHFGLSADLRYLFEDNGTPDMDWHGIGSTLAALGRHGWWVDRLLYPLFLLVTVIAIVRARSLWKNPLFTAAWLAVLAQAAYIFSRQDDSAPRYFLLLVVPVILVVVLGAAALGKQSAPLQRWAFVLLAGVAAFNLVTIVRWVRHPSFQFVEAARFIRQIVDADPQQNRLMLGVSASEMALMTRIPDMNDFGTEDLSTRAQRLHPGWLLVWTGVGDDERAALAPFDLQPVASYSVFDNADRDKLFLYRMVPLSQPAQPSK